MHDVKVQTNTVVDSVRWRRDSAEVTVHNAEGSSILAAPRVLVTLPLALLKAPVGELGVVQFMPPLPAEKLQ